MDFIILIQNLKYHFFIICLCFNFSYRCQLPGELSNASYDLPLDIMNMSYPFDHDDKKLSSCEIYNANFTDSYYSSKIMANESRYCDHWIYNSTSQKTVVTEVKNITPLSLESEVSILSYVLFFQFNLVCDKAWYKSTSDSLLMAGVMVGSIVFGYLSDK